MEVWRAVPVTLEVTGSDATLLDDTIDQIREVAKNIGLEHLRPLDTSPVGDAPVGVRVNTGTLTSSGFEPAPASVRVGVHGESSAP